MRTILIMLSALGAAILVLNLLKSWQRRRADQRGETVSEGVSVIHLISVVVGLAVFFIGALWLSRTRRLLGLYMRQQRLKVARLNQAVLIRKNKDMAAVNRGVRNVRIHKIAAMGAA